MLLPATKFKSDTLLFMSVNLTAVVPNGTLKSYSTSILNESGSDEPKLTPAPLIILSSSTVESASTTQSLVYSFQLVFDY